MKRKQIVQTIKECFSTIKLTANQSIFIPSAGHIFDAEIADTSLRQEQWSDIPLDILMANRDRMSYLTNEGFHFLLPAFLIASIEFPQQVDVLLDNIVFMLTPPDSDNQNIYRAFESRIEGLSRQQSQGIAAFFQNYKHIYPVDEWSFTEKDAIQIERAYAFWKAKSEN